VVAARPPSAAGAACNPAPPHLPEPASGPAGAAAGVPGALPWHGGPRGGPQPQQPGPGRTRVPSASLLPLDETYRLRCSGLALNEPRSVAKAALHATANWAASDTAPVAPCDLTQQSSIDVQALWASPRPSSCPPLELPLHLGQQRSAQTQAPSRAAGGQDVLQSSRRAAGASCAWRRQWQRRRQ